MTAAQVIQTIRELPPEDLAEVIHFVHELERGSSEPSADDPTFKAAAERVFARHSELLNKLAS